MFENLSEADLSQLLNNALVMYRGKPIKVVAIDRRSALCFDLLTQKNISIAAPFKDVVAPQLRIGNVNIGGNVFHVTRRTPRLWTLGYRHDNVSVQWVPYKGYESKDVSQRSLLNLDRSEIAMAMLGKYPTLLEAFKMVNDKKSTIAFDHQFSLSSDSSIYYREQHVGFYNGKKLDFLSEYTYLKELVHDYDQ